MIICPCPDCDSIIIKTPIVLIMEHIYHRVKVVVLEEILICPPIDFNDSLK